MLSERAGNLLNILVNEYIATAAPVSSEDIARLSPSKVSPATVRNTMAQLTDEGYISRPHISSGAVPSDRAYRHYVESLKDLPELSPGMQEQVLRVFGQMDPDVEEWTRRCATLLSRITTNLAIVTVPRATAPRLKHIQLVHLQEFLALLIVVLQEARLLSRHVALEGPTTQDSLDQVATKLNEQFSDLTYPEIQGNQLELSPLEKRVTNDVVGLLHEADTYSFPGHHVDGLRRLLNQPEFSEGQRAQEVVEVLEERVLLDRLLSEVPSGEGIAVYIGAENPEETLHHFGVILGQYGIPQQARGTICVIGPKRMSYGEAISSVTFLSSFMSELVTGLHGGALTS